MFFELQGCCASVAHTCVDLSLQCMPHIPGEFEELASCWEHRSMLRCENLRKNPYEAWNLWSLPCLALRRWNKTLIWPKEASSELVDKEQTKESEWHCTCLCSSVSAFRETVKNTYPCLCLVFPFFSAAESHLWKSRIDTKRNHSWDEV